MKPDWYVQNLSHVRRVIDADSARTDPVLAPLIIGPVSTTEGDFGKVGTFSSPQSRVSAGGYKLIYQRPKKNALPTCYRVGTASVVSTPEAVLPSGRRRRSAGAVQAFSSRAITAFNRACAAPTPRSCANATSGAILRFTFSA